MAPLLALRDVSLGFCRGRHSVQVLDGVSLELCAGELVAVLAQRAQGKSMLLEVAAGVQRPDAGQVIFDDIDLWKQGERCRSKLLASDICLLSNDRPGVDLGARELVALPLLRDRSRRDAYAQADDALRRVGLTQCATQRWDTLADSERSLLMLARGLARTPRLLLIDDLLVGLGLGRGKQIGWLLRTLAEEDGFAVMMSATDTYATICCDRVGSLVVGRLQLALDDRLDLDNTILDFPGASRQALP